MQLSQSELAEKSAFILSKIREKYPDFREMELSGVQDINDALIRVKNAVLLLRAGWSERYDEAMKRFLAEKPEGYKLQSLDYDSISKAVGAYPSCPPNVVREICGLSSEYELHEASSIRNSASEEFSRILRERRIADGSLL